MFKQPDNCKKEVFTVGVVEQWQRLPREVVGFLCLEILKVGLDAALNNLL